MKKNTYSLMKTLMLSGMLLVLKGKH
ncbi:Dihydroorotase [Bienertia sinuspersici]